MGVVVNGGPGHYVVGNSEAQPSGEPPLSFKYYEVVRISQNHKRRAERGRLGYVAALPQGREARYLVYIYDIGEVRSIDGPDLISMGRMDEIAQQPGPTIRVRVDPVTGEGFIVDDTGLRDET